MTETSTEGGAETLRRCCPSHPDLATLLEHLTRDYPDVAPGRVEFEVRRAHDAAALVGLDDDVVATVELLVRSQIALFTGDRTDAARLRPQRTAARHPRPEPDSHA